MTVRGRRRALLVLIALCCLLLASCQGGSSTATPQPAGRLPSPIAKEVCGKKAATEIANVLGETAHVSIPTWRDHLYSCDYRYGAHWMALSVKELSSWPQTYAYFDGLADDLHRQMPLFRLGQGAFQARDGSVVVRKDWKVLLVDISGLPGSFGNPTSTSANVALSVAGVILACWHGD
jgi:hypothetical protein